MDSRPRLHGLAPSGPSPQKLRLSRERLYDLPAGGHALAPSGPNEAKNDVPRLRLSADRQAAPLTLDYGVRRFQPQDGGRRIR